MDNTNESLNYFNKIENGSPFKDSSKWLSVACYLKNKDLDNAKITLNEISKDSNSDYQSKAIELLKKID